MLRGAIRQAIQRPFVPQLAAACPSPGRLAPIYLSGFQPPLQIASPSGHQAATAGRLDGDGSTIVRGQDPLALIRGAADQGEYLAIKGQQVALRWLVG